MSVVAISGGVGGAKLALGLAHTLPGPALSVVVNTGDDFTHLGFAICPDLDTTLYTLAGVVNPETGWGRRDESWTYMDEVARQGGETWFRLGDRDLELHRARTQRLQEGATLSTITAESAVRFGVAARILPMSDAPVRTRVVTDEGDLAFQTYFVRHQCRPRVTSLHFDGATSATPAPGVIAALTDPALEAIILCPSNPWLSIDPIRAIPGMRELVRGRGVPVVAVCPLVGGKAVKGPTAKIMEELGIPVTPASIARHYAGWIDGLILDQSDAAAAGAVGLPVHVCRTLMHSLADKAALATESLAFAASLRRQPCERTQR